MNNPKFALSVRPPNIAYILASGRDRQQYHNVVWAKRALPTYRGDLYLHIPLWWDAEDILEHYKLIKRELFSRFDKGTVRAAETLSDFQKLYDLRGHIVGIVTLEAIYTGQEKWDESLWVSYGGDSPEHHHVLHLTNPRIVEPFKAKGKRRLWAV